MLAELYQYAVNEGLAVRPGFKEKNIKFYISFDADGQFNSFDPIDKGKKILCPDVGSLANGTTKSNVLAEKIHIILNIPDKSGKLKSAKTQFYYETFGKAAEHDPLFRSALESLNNEREVIIDAMKSSKVKDEDAVSIKFNGIPLESSLVFMEWWGNFRKELIPSNQDIQKPDFITGGLCEPLSTTGTFSGLFAVGGHTKGDSLICFDKAAFQSYDLKQAANAAVGEESMAAVNLVLEALLKKSKPLAGAKNIHWFKESTENDLFDLLDSEFEIGLDLGFKLENNSDDESKAEDENRIKALFESVRYKNIPPSEVKNRYYTMSLSGVNGRVMVRNYDEGSYEELYRNVSAWYSDLRIFHPKFGESYPKLWGIYSRMLKFSDDKKKISERIDKELSGISNQILYAVLHNTPLPDSAAAKVVQYIRSDLYFKTGSEDKKLINIDRTACQFLKAWLNRKYRAENKEESIIMDTLNENSTSKAYNVGRLMAVYAEVQRLALGDVGAGVVERYYTSCCTAPALVIGKLATLSQYHLSKLDDPKKRHFSKELEKISLLIGTAIPNTFNLEEQSQFALGFYFQNSEMRTYKKSDNKTETEE